MCLSILKKHELKDVLSDWVRCLKPEGLMRISVPDVGALTDIYAMDNDLSKIIGPLLGGQDYPENFHYSAFDFNSLKDLMIQCGLKLFIKS